MSSLVPVPRAVRAWLAGLGDLGRSRSALLRRVPPLRILLEWAARIGYGARGFVYLSIGAMALLSALDETRRPIGSGGVFAMIADQPLGRVWLVLLGLGLWSFVLWRVLQSLFDVDHEGRSAKALATRAGQAMSGLFYALLAASLFEFLDEAREAGTGNGGEARETAAAIMDLPGGDMLLILAGLAILALGVGNVVRGLIDDFADTLACSASTCRRVVPVARAGYVARGLAYLPLALFVILAGVRARASQARSFGDSLAAIDAQPFGPALLSATALGLMAFGAFAFVEARWRRIRVPRDLTPG